MTQFLWEPEYAIGHVEIDRQHQKIIAILNQLYDLLGRQPAPPSETEQLFDRLADYVSTHFAYEEELLLGVGYPADDLAEHKQTHNRLLAKVQRIAAAQRDGDATALAELLPFLYGNWLIEHICGTDRLYAGYVAPGATC